MKDKKVKLNMRTISKKLKKKNRILRNRTRSLEMENEFIKFINLPYT